MHIHILGICGTFMGGVAQIACASGHKVTGCDAGVYPPMSTQLQQAGIELIEGWDPAQIALAPDLWVVGNVVSRGNPLMEAVLDRGLPYTSGPQWLAEHVLKDKWVLAVAGTHGKTTTSSMLAWVLEAAGRSPGFLIGGVPENFGVSARLTASPYFVIEADEYDTAFFDKRSKFVHYRPKTAVLNNLEFDHADIFADLAAIETQFHHLMRTIPGSGLIVANGTEDSLQRVLARGCWTPIERFGVVSGWDSRELGVSEFDVLQGGEPQGRVQWELLGEHNRMNALAAIAAARHAGVEPAQAIDALSRFANVKRRMEVRGSARGVTVYDDFAHHPTAIALTLAGLRGKVGAARILAVLEPRSNTMKLGVMKDRLAGSLADADQVFCYTGGLGWDAEGALAPLGAKAASHDDLGALVAAIAAAARPGDHVLVMSNGGFGGIHAKLLAALAQAGGSGMSTLIYLHGFNSSPASHKAQLLARDIAERGLADQFFSPALPHRPAAAMDLVQGLIAARHPQALRPLAFVGSSLGGFYATWLAEKYDARAVLINPAVFPQNGLSAYLGPQQNMYTGERYELTQDHLREWQALFCADIHPGRYLLMVETGDEVLDYQRAVERYRGAEQIVVQGGDHTFQSFAQHIPRLLQFTGL